jgi:hypothetical protein
MNIYNQHENLGFSGSKVEDFREFVTQLTRYIYLLSMPILSEKTKS